MKYMLLAICTTLFLMRGLSQGRNKDINGQVKDIQNEPASGATVQLRRAGDSALVQTTVARNNGKFTFTGLANGVYVLHISFSGSKNYSSNSFTIDNQHPVITLPVIILQSAKQTELTEVVVTARKPLIEQDIDKTIVNVEAMISSATANALEVLEKTPGVTIDPDGTINLNGKAGVLVLIEGRPTYMSSQDLAAYLKSIPAGTLDKIELMNNPPAKYDANGSAVINIRFKRNRIQGYTGTVSSSFSQGKKSRYYNSVNLNYLNRKINLFANFSAGKDRNFDDDRTQRIFFDNNYQEISSTYLKNYNQYRSHDFNGRIGMDYTLSPKTIIGFIASVYNRTSRNSGNYTNDFSFKTGGNNDSTGYGTSASNFKWNQVTANVNFQQKFNSSGHELSADANYIRYTNRGGQLLNNFAESGSGIDSAFAFYYHLPSTINIFTVKADYSYPLKNKVAFSAGVKSSFVKNDRQSDYYDVDNDIQTQDLSKSNHFLYSENINALYINIRKDWKRLGGQLGLRAENTNTKGNQLGNAMVPASINTNHYTGLFPGFFLTYKLDSLGKNTLSANYSRRINRPGYQQLNPFVSFIDQYSYSTGNPYLKPSYSQSAEISYRYKQFATVSLQYDGMNHAFFNATQQVNSKFIYRPENATTRSLIAIIVNLNFPVTKWWRTNVNAGTGQFRTKGTIYNQSLDQRMQAFRINTFSQFTFSKSLTGEVSSRYSSRIINLQRIYEPRWQVNAALSKKILKGKGSIRLTVEDIFWSLKQKDRVTGLAFADVSHINIGDTRRVGIAANFNFGKETFARKRRYNDNGADDVKGRVD